MPRTARLDREGLLQHVIVCGIEKCIIFRDDADREWFVNRLLMLLVETETQCLAWSLMTNHFHLLLRPQKIRLGKFMRRLLTGYAMYYNKRYGRVGHLFQNRYKSIVCEEDTYLLSLVRYIHLNPVRAGLVRSMKTLDTYRWSGHAVILGNRPFEGQETSEVLSYFGRRKSSAYLKYRAFVAEGISDGRRPELVGGGKRNSALSQLEGDAETVFDPRVLGSSDFVEQLRRNRQLSSQLLRKISIPELVNRISNLYDVQADHLRQRRKTRPIAEARHMVCYCAVRELGHNGAEVARYLNIGRSAVSNAAKKGELLFEKKKGTIGKILTD